MVSYIPGFAFIEVVDRHARKLLISDGIEIDGHSIPVKRADCNNLPDKMYECVRKEVTSATIIEVNQSEAEASQKNFLQVLNEDCIGKLLKLIGLIDLCSVAKTCKQLNGMAKTVFEQKYKKKTIDLNVFKRKEEIQYFLDNFGSTITSISLCKKIKDAAPNDVVELLEKQCKKVTSLTLRGESMDNRVIKNCTEMFGRLTALNVVPGSLPLNRLLAACPQLEKLMVYSVEDCDFNLKGVSLPKLAQLDLFLFKVGSAKEFLWRHPRIEIFTFQLPGAINFDGHHNTTNELIYECLPNISQIDLYLSWDQTSRFSKMKNLKSVELHFQSINSVTKTVNEFLAQNAPIEKICLSDGTIDNAAIESICKMKTIKRIRFIHCTGLDGKAFIRLIETLPSLEKIVSCIFEMDTVEFLDKILPILKSKGIQWSNRTDHFESVSGSYVSCMFTVQQMRFSIFFFFYKGPYE